ncbi:hypothetical protein GE09DRAFT_296445 [Coniochaeta sp. 2T2.1]|nr:hypothetical protein GE09DRAFT_296445 [Coniochaeta sp. 2T2.1]
MAPSSIDGITCLNGRAFGVSARQRPSSRTRTSPKQWRRAVELAQEDRSDRHYRVFLFLFSSCSCAMSRMLPGVYAGGCRTRRLCCANPSRCNRERQIYASSDVYSVSHTGEDWGQNDMELTRRHVESITTDLNWAVMGRRFRYWRFVEESTEEISRLFHVTAERAAQFLLASQLQTPGVSLTGPGCSPHLSPVSKTGQNKGEPKLELISFQTHGMAP